MKINTNNAIKLFFSAPSLQMVYNEAIALYYDENNQTKKDPNQVFEWECSRNELNSLLVEIEKL